jgi:hypothetical protein
MTLNDVALILYFSAGKTYAHVPYLMIHQKYRSLWYVSTGKIESMGDAMQIRRIEQHRPPQR